MRIIAGSKRGKKLLTLEGDRVRPTIDRVKEALFNILQFRIEGRNFLDLFAGSGQVGLEALSRGAKHAYFVDSSKHSARIIQENIRNTGFEDVVDLYVGDFEGFYRQVGSQTFDIIFLDPPYKENLFVPALKISALYVKPSSLVICEHPFDESLPSQVGELAVAKTYRYGKIALTIYHTIQ